MLKDNGKNLLDLKKDYNGASDLSKKILEGAIKGMVLASEITEEISLSLLTLSLTIKAFEDLLNKTDGYFFSEAEIISAYSASLVNELADTNCEYISSSAEGNNLVIIKKLGMTEEILKNYFDYPELDNIEPTKKKGVKSKLDKEKIEEIIKANDVKIAKYNEFVKQFVFMRLPKVRKCIIDDLSSGKDYSNKDKIHFELTDVYFSEKINGYNIDFKIIIPVEHYISEKNRARSKTNMIAEIKTLVRLAQHTFYKRLGL